MLIGNSMKIYLSCNFLFHVQQASNHAWTNKNKNNDSGSATLFWASPRMRYLELVFQEAKINIVWLKWTFPKSKKKIYI